ncbi:hypothetical protein ES703_97158 [subsurface metagenome]
MGGWATVAMFVSILFFAVGGIAFLIVAFRESILCGLACIFIPFFSLYYVITRWRKARSPFFIILIGLAIFLGGTLPTVIQFKAEAEPVIAEFMAACEMKDVEGAYTCWSSGAITMERVAELIDKEHAWLFEGYESISTSSWSVETGAGATRGRFSGLIAYTDKPKRSFEALLIKVGNDWKITDLFVGR